MGSRMCLVGLPPGIILTASFIFFSLTEDGFKPKEKKSVIKSSNGQYLKKRIKKNIKSNFLHSGTESEQSFYTHHHQQYKNMGRRTVPGVSPALTQ